MTIYKHIHHIIPRHMGGTDDPSNLVELTIEEHAEAHRKLFEEHGHWQDELAWKGLSGMIGKDELLYQMYNNFERRKRISERMKGNIPGNKGIPMSEEQKIKLRKPKTEEHKEKLRKPKSNTEKMGKYIRNEEYRKKRSEISKRIMSIKVSCPTCGLISTKTNITSHIKKGCYENPSTHSVQTFQ